MKNRRYGLQILTFVMVSILLCGCTQKKGTEDTGRMCLDLLGNAYNDLGVVYFNADGREQIASFFDPVSGMGAPLCTKVNCSHYSKNCDAYLNAVGFAAIIGDHLYYLEDANGFQDKNLCIADTNGTNRRVLHSFESTQLIRCGGYEDGYLFFAYYNQYDEDGERLEKQNCGIYLINLETDEVEHMELPENYQSNIYDAMVSEGALYCLCLTNSFDLRFVDWEFIVEHGEQIRNNSVRVELWKYDLTSKEKTCLRSWSGGRVNGLHLGYGYFYAIELDGKTHLENMNTGQVYELELDGHIGVLYDEGVAISDYYGKKFSLWHYDTGELETLGSYADDVSVLIKCITKDWVYVTMYEATNPEGWNDGIGEFYMPREQFMRGEWEWKRMPTW